MPINAEKYYQPKHRLQWDWTEISHVETSGYVDTTRDFSGQANISGSTSSYKVITGYLIKITYQGGHPAISNPLISETQIPNYVNDRSVIQQAVQTTGISPADSYRTSDINCCTCVACLTCTYCCAACFIASCITENKNIFEKKLDELADVAMSKKMAELICQADNLVEKRIIEKEALDKKNKLEMADLIAQAMLKNQNQFQPQAQFQQAQGMVANAFLQGGNGLAASGNGMVAISVQQLQALQQQAAQAQAFQQKQTAEGQPYQQSYQQPSYQQMPASATPITTAHSSQQVAASAPPMGNLGNSNKNTAPAPLTYGYQAQGMQQSSQGLRLQQKPPHESMPLLPLAMKRSE